MIILDSNPDITEKAFICARSISELNIRTGGQRSASDGQIKQLIHFAKQGVKVRLK